VGGWGVDPGLRGGLLLLGIVVLEFGEFEFVVPGVAPGVVFGFVLGVVVFGFVPFGFVVPGAVAFGGVLGGGAARIRGVGAGAGSRRWRLRRNRASGRRGCPGQWNSGSRRTARARLTGWSVRLRSRCAFRCSAGSGLRDRPGPAS